MPAAEYCTGKAEMQVCDPLFLVPVSWLPFVLRTYPSEFWSWFSQHVAVDGVRGLSRHLGMSAAAHYLAPVTNSIHTYNTMLLHCQDIQCVCVCL